MLTFPVILDNVKMQSCLPALIAENSNPSHVKILLMKKIRITHNKIFTETDISKSTHYTLPPTRIWHTPPAKTHTPCDVRAGAYRWLCL